MIATVNLFLCLFFFSNLFTLNVFAESLNDLPWMTEKGNWIISAKLYKTSNQPGSYEIREYIHASESIRGKISITSLEGKKVDILYSSDFKNERIIINDGDCRKNIFTYNWSEQLFTIATTKPLLNHILMTGPSILFRLEEKSLLWTQGPETTIRGFSARPINATFGKNLAIKCYFKTHKGSVTELSKADRIEFNGYDVSLGFYPDRENFYLDIYSITKTDEKLDKIVTVTPGLGCPSSLIYSEYGVGLSPPSLKGSNFHFFSTVSIDGPTKSITKNEVYVDSDISGLSVRASSQTTGTTELFYDYNLGLIYELQKDGRCQISAIGPDSPGISEYKTFYAPEILYHDEYEYNYLGKVFLDHGSSYEADVWEMIDYNYQFKANHYDKFIKTQYFVPSSDAQLFDKYVLVRTTLKGLNKTASDSYKLIETISIDYNDLEKTDSTKGIGTSSNFRLSDCYPDSKDRKTFAIHLDCKLENAQDHDDQTECVKFAEKHYIGFLGNVKRALTKSGVSLTRIADLDMIFDNQGITIYATILRVPDIKDGLPSSFMNVAESTIASLRRVDANSEDGCLQKVASMQTRNEVIFYCEKGSGEKICGRIGETEKIDEDLKGNYCKVYRPFLRNSIENYIKEIPLDKIESQFNRKRLRLEMFSSGTISYQSTNVVDVTAQSDRNSLFQIAQNRAKLPDDKFMVSKATANPADCYRSCAHNDLGICETFSFCHYPDKVICSVSDMIYTNLSLKAIVDSSCNIYSKNRLSDYVKINSKKFKQPPSIATDTWIEECASLCSASDDCFSFQQCGRSCTFAGFYTDSLAIESDDCDIYIPKVSHRFSSTGKKIVSDVFHTEFNLNLDQCASLCHGWVNDDETCLSFNFCPQSDSSSSCSLTKYSVKDSSTKTIDSVTCKNYELKKQSDDNKQIKQKTDQIKIKVTTGGAAFGYIIGFLALGLITGFVASYSRKFTNFITHRVSAPSLRQEDSTFEWSKQVNDDGEG